MNEKPKKAGYKMLQEDEFMRIKSVLGLGLSNLQVSKLVGRGHATVHYIDKSSDFEAYRKTVREIGKVRAAKVAAETSVETPIRAEEADIPPVSANEVKVLTAEPLERIALALERLADAWEATPVKKGRFF